MNELVNRCLSLSRHKRESLIKVLQKSLVRNETNGDSRFQVLLKVATDMFGQGILTGSREFGFVLARRMIVYQMREDGYSYPVIGRYLTKHHATVIHMQKMMEDIFRYPEMFKLEMAYWDEFQKRLKEYETNG